MKYAMLIYETDADIQARTNENKEMFWAAWRRLSQSFGRRRRICRRRCARTHLDGYHGALQGRQAPGAGRSLRRYQGAARRFYYS
jgi:hypothetical protein